MPKKSRPAARAANSRKGRAVIVVDVQRAFEIPPAMVKKISDYIKDFDVRVFTRFINRPGSLFRQALKQHSCAPGSPDLELLVPPERGDIVIDKTGYGLREKDVTRLKRAGVREAVVCGVDTDACVMGVMFSLFDSGIVPRLKENLCWSSSGLHGQAMRIIREQFP